MDLIRAQMERKVDAPLFWSERNERADGPTVSGFLKSERFVADVKLTTQEWVDVESSALCDGTTCSTEDGRIAIEQSECRARMELGFEVSFETTVTGVRGKEPGKAFLWLGQDEPNLPRGNAFADLATLPGSLEVSWPAAPGEESGTLILSFEFAADVTSGNLMLQFSRLFGVTGAEYFPLQGYWPSLPAAPPDDGKAGPESDTQEPVLDAGGDAAARLNIRSWEGHP